MVLKHGFESSGKDLASSSSPESGIETGSPESGTDTNTKNGPLHVSFRVRSLSEASQPIKGILKRRSPLLRCQSECESDGRADSPTSPFPSLASLYEEDGTGSCGERKSVRFNDRIIRHHFRSKSSIIPIPGEGKNRTKKNQKRKMQRLRRNSAGESSTEQGTGSESESYSEGSDHRRSSVDTEDKGLQFPIEPIPEDKELPTPPASPAPEDKEKRHKKHRERSQRAVSISDDEDESSPRPQLPPHTVPSPPPEPDSDHHGDGEGDEVWEPSAAEKKRLRKKRKKAARKAAKAATCRQEEATETDTAYERPIPVA